ncbi:MAG: YggT family protein [Anaerolineae bacterium]|nr:YggT family protein [Anaerolineae bacterium]
MVAIAEIVKLCFYLYSMVILARVLMSWINIDPYSPVARAIHDMTEPVLAPVRNMLPQAGGMDFSPIIVLIGMQFLGELIYQILIGM